MSISEDDRAIIEAFREHVEGAVSADDRYGESKRLDREDGSTLATRFEMGEDCWLEVVVRPLVPQVRVGFLTTDRWKSEEIEQAIQDSGDTMEEFVEMGFSEAGLDWDEPPVEHYRDAGEFFCFITPLEIEELFDLAEGEVQGKVVRMLEGYLVAFGPAMVSSEEE